MRVGKLLQVGKLCTTRDTLCCVPLSLFEVGQNRLHYENVYRVYKYSVYARISVVDTE